MTDDKYEHGSRVEAVAAVVHHRAASALPHHLHHPMDPNAGVLRGRLGPHARVTAAVAVAVTIVGVVLLALALGNGPA